MVYCPGGYSEHQDVPAEAHWCVLKQDRKYVPVNFSGLPAAVSIRELCRLKPLGIALITAASGGTRSIEVQLLKKYGCKCVAGTCSTPEKAEFLRGIWCD